jgi:chromatin structure-remodeling complex subunit RSC9
MAPPAAAQTFNFLPEEHNAFIEKLAAYHQKRGTPFDPEPRVGTKQVDLQQLFRIVVDRGGYDVVSDEKLAWRKVAEDFHLGTNNLPALAFSLKTTYYKQLAAYEISTIHNKEPPPREILEDITAKGGGLLTRTLENYRPSTRRETGALGNPESEASGDDMTPARERGGSEEAPGSGGRVTRGLRQAPPQRILFQPDTQSSRQTRNVSATSHAPSPQHHSNSQHQQQQPRGASAFYNPTSNMENHSTAVANYEPRPQMPLTLRPVYTPGNNPIEFARREKVLRDAQTGRIDRAGAVSRGVEPPGSMLHIFLSPLKN